ncbi:MAG: dihydrofolate reductase [Eubacteriales bacterium]|nr:dihydrofolate reductase [Eubacteriales bacterium]
MLRAIVAVDEQWAIGCANRLLFHLPKDLQHFKQTTLGKPVVMGRKTMESLPGGRPLPGRRNLVLTTDAQRVAAGFEAVTSVKEAVAAVANEEAFVIGGEQIYRLFLPHCDEVIVTHVETEAVQADAFFPPLSEQTGWRIGERSERIEDGGLSFYITRYVRI